MFTLAALITPAGNRNEHHDVFHLPKNGQNMGFLGHSETQAAPGRGQIG
jgi:hypothetical protein